MLRNVLIMASSGIVLFSKEYANGVAQVFSTARFLHTRRAVPYAWSVPSSKMDVGLVFVNAVVYCVCVCGTFLRYPFPW